MRKKILALVLSLMVATAFMPCMAFAEDEGIDPDSIYISKDGSEKSYTSYWGTKTSLVVSEPGESFQLELYDSEGNKLDGGLAWECYSTHEEDEGFDAEISKTGLVKTGSAAGIMCVSVEGTLKSGDDYYGDAEIYIGGKTMTALKDSDNVIYRSNFSEYIEVSTGNNATQNYDLVVLPSLTSDKENYECESGNDAVLTAGYKNGTLSVTARKTGRTDVYLIDENGDYVHSFTFLVNGTCKGTENYDAIVYTNKSAEITWLQAKSKITIPSKIKYTKNDGNKKYIGTYTVKTISTGSLYEGSKVKKVYVPQTVKKITAHSIGYYFDESTGEDVKCKNLTIYAKKNTAAYKYAKIYKFNWKKWNK